MSSNRPAKRARKEEVAQLETNCATLGDLLKSLAKTADGDPSKVRDQLLSALNQITDIKRSVRGGHKEAYQASQATAEEQTQLDQLHLQLQNILYEKIHIEKEIQRCKKFRSRHESIDMVTAEEFAAESAGLAEESAGNAHKAMLARLDHELQARKRLQKEFKELKARKQAIKQSNDSKREKLRKLPGHLNSILTAAQPLEKYIGADQGLPAMTKTSPEAYLPPAMYILFVYLNEFRKVNGDIKIEVTGDMSAAKSAQTVAEWETMDDAPAAEEADEDGDDDDERESRRDAEEAVDPVAQAKELEEKQKRLMALHPLRVKAFLKCAGSAGISIEFAYLTQLKVVTVFSKLDQQISVPNSIDVLGCLFPGDVGDELPTAASAMMMDSLSMDPWSEYAEASGRPYRWAQIIAGMTSADTKADTVAKRIAHRSMVQVLERIKESVSASGSLAKQLTSIASCKLTVDTSATAHLFPVVINVKMKLWEKLTRPEGKDDMLHVYRAMFKHEDIELQAIVKLSMVYPCVPPHFQLSLTKPQHDGEAANLRAMEAEVNVHFEELMSKGVSAELLLTHQLRRLQMCFNVYCEAVGPGGADSHLYERGIRGKDRLRPYCFDQDTQKFVHR